MAGAWLAAVLLLAGAGAAGGALAEPRAYTGRVVAAYPHDPRAFTQGLIFDRGALIESTGGYGRSSLRRTELRTGRVITERRLASHLFGEGLARAGDLLVQLTWRAGRAFLYEPEGFEARGSFEYPGEGWGLAFDGKHLVMSDGSATLRFLSPSGFAEVRRVEVRDRGVPVPRLNELEYVEGRIYANVWHEDRIAVISPRSGEVQAWIDLSGLWPAPYRRSPEQVLNGIAYDPEARRLFVTGKEWPRLFEIELRSAGGLPEDPKGLGASFRPFHPGSFPTAASAEDPTGPGTSFRQPGRERHDGSGPAGPRATATAPAPPARTPPPRCASVRTADRRAGCCGPRYARA